MSTPDRGEIRRRVLTRLFGHPITLIPGLFGVVSLLSPVLFNMEPAVPVFAGVVGLVAAGSSVAIRLLTGREAISAAVYDELTAEQEQDRLSALNALQGRLQSDGDPRTDRLFADVRNLVEAVRRDTAWRSKMNDVAVMDVDQGLDKLLEGCVNNLKRSLELLDMADSMHSEGARRALMDEREALVAEVQSSVESLTHLMTSLRLFGAGGENQPDLQSLRAELDNTLKAAQATAEETDSWAASARARAAARNKERS